MYDISSLFISGVFVNSISAPAAMAAKKTEEQFRKEVEELNNEGVALNEHRIRIQTEIERARSEREELEAKFMQEFGTSDLEQIERVIAEREASNQAKVDHYRAKMVALRSGISEVNAELAKLR